ncbi:MAG TPA: RNA polymerase sigma factor [Puia sp.]|nr:RNA polymerase sigma factor [Puia sp.]
MDTLSDNALMLKVKEDDFDKMALLFERYHRALFGFLFKMTKQKQSSEDLVQNVFFRMLKYRNTFTGVGEFKTWMYHLARNVLHDYFKQIKRSEAQYDIRDFEDRMGAHELADLQIERKQELKTLEMALENLSEENRELLILCRYQELKYNEIAEILNITEGAVKVRVHRALGQLKSNYLKIAN